LDKKVCARLRGSAVNFGFGFIEDKHHFYFTKQSGFKNAEFGNNSNIGLTNIFIKNILSSKLNIKSRKNQ